MNLLCWDTCTQKTSYALFKEGRCVFQEKWCRDAAHDPGKLLVSKIKESLESVNLRMGELAGFCVTCGPGSFTGIRLGLSMAHGFSQALGKPVASFSLFEIFHGHVFSKAPGHQIWIVVNTYGAFLAVQIYSADGHLQGEPFLIMPQRLEEALRPRAETEETPHLLVGVGIDLKAAFPGLSNWINVLEEEEVSPPLWMGMRLLEEPQRLHRALAPQPFYLKNPTVFSATPHVPV